MAALVGGVAFVFGALGIMAALVERCFLFWCARHCSLSMKKVKKYFTFCIESSVGGAGLGGDRKAGVLRARRCFRR